MQVGTRQLLSLLVLLLLLLLLQCVGALPWQQGAELPGAHMSDTCTRKEGSSSHQGCNFGKDVCVWMIKVGPRLYRSQVRQTVYVS